MVITAKNPVISVLLLIAVFINVAGYLVLLGVAYLGLVYLIVYVGAIAILFLFVIMMLNLRLVELVDTGQEYTKNLPMAAFIGALLLSVLSMASQSVLAVFNTVNRALLLPLSIGDQPRADLGLHSRFNNNVTDMSMASFTQIERIGQGLYTYASL
jgi:NADH-ubiquinone oxidoreductase chain 6